MLYEEGYEPEAVLTQGMEDAILIVSNLSPPCLKHGFSYHQESGLVPNVTFLPDSSLLQNTKVLLLQKEKLVWTQEKVQILVVIHASLPAIAKKAAVLQAAGVPNLDAAIITGAATSLSEGPRSAPEG